MTKEVTIKNVKIGNGNPVAIQSMTNTKTGDVDATIAQINALKKAGCDIVRFTVNDAAAAKAVKRIVDGCDLPLVADIHFDYRLALKAIENGIHKIRINPGNIGAEQNVRAVVDAAKLHNIPIRVGVNGGSIQSDLLKKYGNTAKSLYESAVQNVRLLEKFGFDNIVISAKASDVKRTIDVYRLLSKLQYPLHIGVTEAGLGEDALVKSSVALGSLLADGIGDTVRVSMTGDPVQEVSAAKKILRAVGLDNNYVEIVACPTCGRTAFDMTSIVEELKERTKNINKNLKIAVMGCVVNGPGEARECNFGIAGGADKSALFVNGKVVGTVDNDKITETLMKLTEEYVG